MKNLKSQHNFRKEIKDNFGIDLTHFSKSKIGFSQESYRAKLNGKLVFLRISQSNRGLSPEKYANELANSAGVHTPKIIHYLKTKTLPYEILIMENANGVNLNDIKLSNTQEQKIYHSIGDNLRRIHSIKLKGFGPLVSQNNSFRGEIDSWKRFIMNKRRGYTKLLKNLIVTPTQLTEIKRVFEEVANLKVSPVFIHDDYHASHIFIDKNKVSDIIDFSRAGVGDARYDIAKTLYHLSPKQTDYFRAGYGRLSKDSIIEKYILVINTRKAIWTLENNIEKKTHAIANLRKILKRL